MLDKTAIRIIKRGTTKSREQVESRAQAPSGEGNRSERSRHREIAGKVSGWIADHRNRERPDTLAEIRRLFGGERSAGEAA